ncbi:carbamoyl phosphate synthase small subunit [Alkalicoccus luteus]|uniref:Carbamoyl phosphate synthase small chain n=1 Tax=Alkalicoccus luteus TaxID=1237094 RepID=A0A969TUT3_9BACI|nr:carbamoyl phosphate synthase small subunit [Alkalicoccus luteus]NJP37296.1 carbamoyl phosphate synthase small subunit [Alkalicoccus luteus]
MTNAYLILDTGDVLEGKKIGADTESSGELVFNTAMTGYQEMMTDPSYKGQLLTFTYPLIGNYGFQDKFNEGSAPAVEAVVTGSTGCDERAEEFDAYLQHHGIPGLTEVDTRKLVKIIRTKKTVKGFISVNQPAAPIFHFNENPVPEVSVQEPVAFTGEGPHVAVLDYGCKSSIVHALLKEGCAVTMMPHSSSAADIHAIKPDGVLLSNGPGDPLKLQKELPHIKELTKSYPVLGICLGHQLIALAYGAESIKLPFGHRGSNHPVRHIPDGKVYMSSQNHGYVVSEPSDEAFPFERLFENVNDGTCEGFRHRSLPVQSVQFHPEAHPGPSDTHFIFKQFINSLVSGGSKVCAAT